MAPEVSLSQPYNEKAGEALERSRGNWTTAPDWSHRGCTAGVLRQPSSVSMSLAAFAPEIFLRFSC